MNRFCASECFDVKNKSYREQEKYNCLNCNEKKETNRKKKEITEHERALVILNEPFDHGNAIHVKTF